MGEATWTFGPDDGTIVIHTGVTGRAARTGHRLTIEMREWSGTATSHDDQPVAVKATIRVDSLNVISGEGGLTPLSGPERSVVRTNALKSLTADKFREIEFAAESIDATSDGYRATGMLTIHGQSRPHALEFQMSEDDGRRTITAESTVIQSDFGIKPYGLMMGALKVADDVRVVIDFAVGA